MDFPRSHAYARRLIYAGLSAMACSVLVAACGPGTPGAPGNLSYDCLSGRFQTPPPDLAFDQCGAGGGGGATGAGGGVGCACGRPFAPMQNPSISSVQCPETLCGQISWTVNFTLPQPSTTCGWVIQELTANSLFGKDHFWEAFYIPAGATGTMPGMYSPGDDTYGNIFTHPLNSMGTETVTGVAKFYEGQLPADFVYCDALNSTPAGGRRFTRNQPSGWDGSGTPHTITINWNCTANPGVMPPNTCNVTTTPPDPPPQGCMNPCQ